MTDILALLQPIQNSVSKTTLRQLSRIIVTMIAMTSRVTMLSRMMSLMMLSSTALFPISQAISGALSKWSLTLLFVLPGLLVLLMTVWITVQPELNNFSASFTKAEAEG